MDTDAGRSIRHCLDMIAPFEASESEREEGQRQFYDLMLSIYRGMLERPEEYLVFPAPYEAYREKKKEEKRERAHGGDARESTLRNTFQQAIQFYAAYLYRLGVASQGIAESGALVLAEEAYEDVLEQMGRIHEAKYNDQRYQVLERMGVRVWREDGAVYVAYRAGERAMEGLWYLCGAPESKYKWMNFLRLDYKNAYAPIPAVEDICRTLPEESREIVRRLEDQLAGKKVRAKIKPLRGIVSDFRWKVEYARGGKNICGFYADSGSFLLCIHFNRAENISAFADALYEEDRALFRWFQAQFPERLCKCPNNRRVRFGGEYRRICGLSNRAEIVNPTCEDVDRALEVLRRYRGMAVDTKG